LDLFARLATKFVDVGSITSENPLSFLPFCA
jgi:hypothetical protein